jgi:ATP-dependent RNA helicase CshB
MTFSSLNLKKYITSTLDKLHIQNLTDIQEKTIPLGLKKKSMVIVSRTGSGKTFCFLVPILNNLDFENKNTQAVIVVPTKELARQIYSKILLFKNFESMIRCTLLIGNEDVNRQIQSIKASKPQIIVGTPNRILELVENKTINKNIKTLVMDEFDMLIDLGFTQVVDKLFKQVNSIGLQKICCSATAHQSLANKFKKYLTNTEVISNNENI